ncbi:S8 family peptidase [Candidatus Solirubrobacter pratensis]|uniref:S8 family peptidase n=1 Tax=Candidatus Solirubrobacter pratensis TaxID=1298857 RepID=UPI0004274E6A|nr:S8 family serine peptidase [Candidatus Solirubrobacter pratensis]
MRAPVLAGALAAAAFAVAQSATADSATQRDYVVVYKQGAAARDAHAAIEAAGGRIVSENADIGVATVRSTDAGFEQRAAQQGALEGAAPEQPIGQAPADAVAKREAVERPGGWRAGKGPKAPKLQTSGKLTPDPLAGLQWDMQAIGATADGSYKRQQGSHDVHVGIMDTGVDASHPDIKPNFDSALSRNFTVDDPIVDGTCASDPDGSCTDPANVDENGHGTHVAGIIGAALNGIGTAGVAPGVDLVNLRAGQDSGYFFVGPTLDALTYAGDNGIDVVNMSFYIDPWLYNCQANPTDSPAEQREQRLIVSATQRALDYARGHGVTLISASGNEDTDLGNPGSDDSSPDYPDQVASPHHREIDNGTCLSMPTEANGVIAVNATAPNGRKAYYSNYGLEQSDVSAPGGDAHQTGTPTTITDTVLAPYPESLARANGQLNPDGSPKVTSVVRDCENGACAYYQYLQGTSMASPHAVGVAALAVAQYGNRDRAHGGLTLDPADVEARLRSTATDTPCPAQNPFVYPGLPDHYTATCEGTAAHNGFYGDGVVNAARIIAGR